ncbi:transposase (ISL3 family) [Anoxybacillus gonensis]|nr:transposase (ISL3 family) [Anoxybacillus gonensis]
MRIFLYGKGDQTKPNHWRKIRMYSPFIKELIDLSDVLIQKVRKEEERWIFELSLPEQCSA